MSQRPLLQIAALVLGSVPARALQSGPPCAAGWAPEFAFSFYTGNSPKPDGPVYASAIFDDGSGPRLYIGGDFGRIGNRLCRSIACWDGQEWSPVGDSWSPNGSGAGIAHAVRALAVYDDGSGPALYAGGYFATGHSTTPPVRIARWDGTSWSVPGGGVNGSVQALQVHDDGSGSKLFVAGDLSTAGGQPAARIASWDGSSWSPLGTGIGAGHVSALASYDDGTGRRLFAGGKFTTAGGVTVNHVARWDGSGWSALGSGIGAPPNGGVFVLYAHDDGTGGQLYAGGYFQQAGGTAVSSIARWNGSTWSGVGPGFSSDVRALARYDDGGGTKLYAGGTLYVAGQPEYGFFRWDGASWSGVGGGVIGGPIETLLAHDDGLGSRLFVGGEYTETATLFTGRITAWSAAGWATLGTLPPANGVSGPVLALAAHDEGTGPALYAAGYFGTAGSQSANVVARWDGTGWSAMGAGFSGGTCDVLASFDDGSGSALYAGGAFTHSAGVLVNHVVRWNGTSWNTVAGGLGGAFARIRCLLAFDDGSGRALYAAGTCSASQGSPMTNIARWNGSAWSQLGSGLGALGDKVHALAAYDDGGGPALYAGGSFPVAGGLPVANIARWDGTVWSSLGGGVGVASSSDSVHALCVFDDGSGPALFAGGEFGQAGGTAANGLARWDGASWSAVPGLSAGAIVHSLRVVDDGSGPALSVAGEFTAAGGSATGSLARWNGLGWSSVGGGPGGSYFIDVEGGLGDAVNPVVYCQEFFDDGSAGGADLYLGGCFDSAGSYVSSFLARWNTCAEILEAFCTGDGSTADCPCANPGLAGRGCENSVASGGARLDAAGLVQDDSLVLTASGLLPSALTIFLQGTSELAPVAFGDGLRCTGGALKRLYVENASGGVASVPQAGDPSIRARSAALGDPILQGDTRLYQAYYRDANAGFCPAPQGSTFNVSSGVRVRW